MAIKKQGKEKVTTIKLTADQRVAVKQATGISLKELSLIEQSATARAVGKTLLRSVRVLLCW